MVFDTLILTICPFNIFITIFLTQKKCSFFLKMLKDMTGRRPARFKGSTWPVTDTKPMVSAYPGQASMPHKLFRSLISNALYLQFSKGRMNVIDLVKDFVDMPRSPSLVSC